MKKIALALSKWYAELAENDNGYTTLAERHRLQGSPTLDSNLDEYFIKPPKPKIQKIDMSILIGSDIDCEFMCEETNYVIVGNLIETPTSEFSYYTSKTSGVYDKCKVRENHWHYWGGNWYCPLPKGLNIELRTRNGSIKNEKDYSSMSDWIHRKWVQYDDDIIGFKVLGVAEGWEY